MFLKSNNLPLCLSLFHFFSLPLSLPVSFSVLILASLFNFVLYLCSLLILLFCLFSCSSFPNASSFSFFPVLPISSSVCLSSYSRRLSFSLLYSLFSYSLYTPVLSILLFCLFFYFVYSPFLSILSGLRFRLHTFALFSPFLSILLFFFSSSSLSILPFSFSPIVLLLDPPSPIECLLFSHSLYFFFSISFLLFYSFYLIFSLRNISFFLLFFPFFNSVSSPIFSTLQFSLVSHTNCSLVLHPPYLSSAVYSPIISIFDSAYSDSISIFFHLLFSIFSLNSIFHLFSCLLRSLRKESNEDPGLNLRPYNSVKTPVLRPNSWT